MNILIVDDSATMRAALSRMVERMGHVARVASSGEEALTIFATARPDMMLLDVLMGGRDGYEVAREIRKLATDSWMPIIFLSSREEDQDLERGITAGGDDYLVKPVSFVVLAAKVRAMQRIDEVQRALKRTTDELEIANRELERLSHYDGLTGIANRRFLDDSLLREVERARRSEGWMSTLLIDIDRFKAFNDRYGHVMGDDVLKRVAVALQTACRRTTDVVARYGGEEFCVILAATDHAGATATAEALLQSVRNLAITHADSDYGFLTVSIGVHSTVPEIDTTVEDILLAVDEALYQSKNTGRNRATSTPTSR